MDIHIYIIYTYYRYMSHAHLLLNLLGYQRLNLNHHLPSDRLVPVAALLQLCLASSYMHWMEPTRSYQQLDRLEASLHGAPHGSYAEAVSSWVAGADGCHKMIP